MTNNSGWGRMQGTKDKTVHWYRRILQPIKTKEGYAIKWISACARNYLTEDIERVDPREDLSFKYCEECVSTIRRNKLEAIP